MAEPVRDERTMTDAEGVMWRLEAERAFSSNFATVTILDGPLDVERLRARMRRGVQLVPRLRQRVQERPFGLPPAWVDVADFDPDYHIRHSALPAPGSDRQLYDMATSLVTDPFDRARPLWEFYVVDGLTGGRSALINKMHHTISDGENGVRMSRLFTDFQPDAPDPRPLTPEQLEAAVPRPAPTQADAFVEAMGNGVRQSAGLLRQLGAAATEPGRLLDAGAGVVNSVKGALGQLTDTERAHSTLWAERSLQRRLEVLRVPFEPTKAAAGVLGGTLNVAFLTAASEAAAAYHRRLGAPIDSLRASMAISVRTKSSGANAFTIARLRVPTGDMPIAERFGLIQAATEEARESARTSGGFAALAGLAALLPMSVLLRLARQQTGTIDFATSNVKTASFPCYIAGSEIVANYPVGPLAGVAFNLTLLSYNGSLDMGLHLDPAAVTEPEVLREELERAFQALAATKPARKRGQKGAKKQAPRKKAIAS